MIDKREQILVRLEAMLGVFANGGTVMRNRVALKEDARPAYVLLDGSEGVVTQMTGRRGQASPCIMQLEPQMWALLKVREPARADELGPELSLRRMLMLDAVLRDPTLWALVGTNGRILFLGSATDMQTGSSMEGQLQMNFAFQYVLDPQDLS